MAAGEVAMRTAAVQCQVLVGGNRWCLRWVKRLREKEALRQFPPHCNKSSANTTHLRINANYSQQYVVNARMTFLCAFCSLGVRASRTVEGAGSSGAWAAVSHRRLPHQAGGWVCATACPPPGNRHPPMLLTDARQHQACAVRGRPKVFDILTGVQITNY